MSAADSWQEVFRLAQAPEIAFGVSNGVWGVRTPEGAVYLVTERPTSFLRVLESDWTTLSATIAGGWERLDIVEAERVPFPWEHIMRNAFARAGEYWQALALDRLEESGFRFALKDELRELSKNGVTQRIRQKARRAAARCA